MVSLIRCTAFALALGAGVAAAELLDRVVAVVEDDIITQAELQERVDIIAKQIQQGGTPLPPRNQLIAQVLEYMVIARLQLQLAEKRGISLPKASVCCLPRMEERTVATITAKVPTLMPPATEPAAPPM